jgi:hypothetical protein
MQVRARKRRLMQSANQFPARLARTLPQQEQAIPQWRSNLRRSLRLDEPMSPRLRRALHSL